MGIFSVFTGFMYNDIFSKTLHLWQSGWEWPSNSTGLVVAEPTGNIYPFGMDPMWHGSDNALIFNNSYKMKMSIILGVIHVSFLFLYASWKRGEYTLTKSRPFCLDDFCNLSPSAEPHSFQETSQHLCGIYPTNALLPLHLWLPRCLHHLQVVCRLVSICH